MLKDHLTGYVPLVLEQGSASLLALAFGIVGAMGYSNEVYGWMVLAWGLTSLVILLWRAVLGVPFVVEFSSSDALLRATALQAMQGLTRLLQVVAVGIALLGAVLALGLPEPGRQVGLVFSGAALFLAALLPREMWRHQFLAEQRMSQVALYGTCSNVVAGGFFAGAVLIFWLHPFFAWAALALGVSLGSLAMSATRSGSRWSLDGGLGALQRWWLSGKHVLVGVISGHGVVQLMLWMLLFCRGESEVALAGAAMILIGLPRPAIAAMTAALTPKIAASIHRESLVVGTVLSSGNMLVFLPFAVAFVCVAISVGPLASGVLFPNLPIVPGVVLGTFAAAIALEFLNAMIRGLQRGQNRARDEGRASLVSAGGMTAVGLASIPAFGISGVAMASLAGQVIFLMSSVVLQRRALSKPADADEL